MAKRQSTNTLFNYFTKSPSTSKTLKVENTKQDCKKKEDTEDSLVAGKRILSGDDNSSDEDVGHKKNLKKRPRILSDSESDSEQPKINLDKFEIGTPKGRAPELLEQTEVEREALSIEATSYIHSKLEFLQKENIKDAKRRRPSDPNYDPTTLYVPDKFLSTLTPGVRQWWDLKSRNFDCVLFFKVGKFYELYHMDADIAVKELNCAYMKGDFAHSGFPEISYDKMASVLVQRGYKVARVEQTETPDMMTQRCKMQRQVTKFDRVVKREICQITNRGTEVPGVQCSFAGSHKPNYMLAITEKVEDAERTYGICFVDTSIGEFSLGQFVDDKKSSRLRTLLSHNPPALVLYSKENISNETQRIIKTSRFDFISELLPNDPNIWNAEIVLKKLHDKYYTRAEDKPYPESLKIMQKEDAGKPTAKLDYALCLGALGACIWYLCRCLIDQRVLTMATFKIYTPPDASEKDVESNENPVRCKRYMILDSTTLSNLRLTEEAPSLFHTLDQCCTKFGKRLLHFWICCPSNNLNEIKERQLAIAEFISSSNKVDEIRSFFKSFADYDRQLSQIHGFATRPSYKDHPDSRAILFEEKIYNKKKIKTFISLLRGFRSLTDIPKMFHEFESNKLIQDLTQLAPNGNFPDLKPLLDYFDAAFDHSEALEQGVIAPEEGVDEEYDSIGEKIKELETEMESYLQEQGSYFGCEVKYFGHDKKRFQLEIPESRSKKATSEYSLEGQRKGSIPVRRYSTTKTKEFLKQMMQFEDDKNKILKEIAGRVYKKFSDHYDVWKKSLDCVAELDVLLSLAMFTRSQPVICVPELFPDTDSPFIEIEEGYHPCMTTLDSFIPNDIKIGGSTGSLFLLTGPNMGGKSTLMRQAGLIAVLAHLGAHVPASSCKMSLVDRIFTRLGAQDDIVAGCSTFLVELNETSSIIKNATKNSLVLLDELGRGTATYDGTAIAVAVASFLANLGCRCIFSTHYHNLINYFEGNKAVALGHMACMVENENEEDPTEEAVTFLYKLAPGVCPKSYGFNAAKLAGMPNKITKRAFEVAKTLAERALRKKLFVKILSNTSASAIRQLVKTHH